MNLLGKSNSVSTWQGKGHTFGDPHAHLFIQTYTHADPCLKKESLQPQKVSIRERQDKTRQNFPLLECLLEKEQNSCMSNVGLSLLTMFNI